MEEGFSLLSEFLNGRSIYAPVRRLLNLVFAVSITSYWYSALYGDYTIAHVLNPEKVLGLFASGRFFIPFSLFVVVYYSTQWVAVLVFALLGNLGARWLIGHLGRSDWSKKHVRVWLRRIYRSNQYTQMGITPELLEIALDKARTELTEVTLMEIRKDLRVEVKKAEANFILFCRTILAMTIYVNVLPMFSTTLYWSALGVLIVAISIVCMSVVVLHVVPEWLKRLRAEFDVVLETVQHGQPMRSKG